MKKTLFIIFLFFLILKFNIFSNNISNSKVVLDGVFYDWIVYYTDEKLEERKCYIVTFATKSEGNYKERENPYIMIAISNDRNVEEVSINSGFLYKKNSAIYLGVENKQFKLFTKDNFAWAKNNIEDKIIIKEILNSEILRVRSESLNGEFSIDTYSTKGIARAYKQMQNLCSQM